MSDYRRFEQVQKQEADHEKQEQLAQVQREAVTCRSAVSERRLDSVHTALCTMGLVGWAEVRGLLPRSSNQMLAIQVRLSYKH